MYFLAYTGLMKHYVSDVPHITGLYSANCGFAPTPIIGSVQGQGRRKSYTCNEQDQE